MERVEREGLCSESSLELFVNWYTLGGMQRGLTLTEILGMPRWLLKDFRYILGVISTTRTEKSRADKAFNPEPKRRKRGK